MIQRNNLNMFSPNPLLSDKFIFEVSFCFISKAIFQQLFFWASFPIKISVILSSTKDDISLPSPFPPTLPSQPFSATPFLQQQLLVPQKSSHKPLSLLHSARHPLPKFFCGKQKAVLYLLKCFVKSFTLQADQPIEPLKDIG